MIVQPPLGLKPDQRSFGLPKAVAFLHIVDPEEQLLDATIQTESIISAAAILDIGEATARTHLKQINAKTSAASFASLIAQVHKSTSCG